MKRVIPLFFVMSILSCGIVDRDSQFSESNAYPVKVVATVSLETKTSVTTQEADTILPTDSVFFQGGFSPNRSVKTTSHWWVVDNVVVSEDYYFKWGFTTPGRHDAIFYVKDQFGDLLCDTAIVWVNRPPYLDTTTSSPSNHTWGVSPSIKGLQFSWNAKDPDPNTILTHHFRLWQTSCATEGKETLLVDTLLSRADFVYWDSLAPMCNYSWSVELYDNFSQYATSKISWHFSTLNFTSLGTIKLFVPTESALIQLQQFGGIRHKASGSREAALLFEGLTAGNYTLTIQDTLNTGYTPLTKSILIGEGQFLDLDTLKLQDTKAPFIGCINCNVDTLLDKIDFSFALSDKGCGLDTNNIHSYLDGNPIPFVLRADTLKISYPEFFLVERDHPLELQVSDRCGNLMDRVFILKRDDD